MSEIGFAVFLFVIAGLLIYMSVRSFLQKGFLFNNAYIYASEQERETMNKKPYYHQSGVVFLLIAVVFILNGIDVILKTDWMIYVVITVISFLLIYAVVSSVILAKKNR